MAVRRVACVVSLGTLSTVVLCWYGAFRLHASRQAAVVMLFGHVQFSSSDMPDPRFVDPGRFSFHGQTRRLPPLDAPTPTGWFGYSTSRDLPGPSWCSTQVFLVKAQPTDTSQPARIADRLKDNPFGDFPRWSAAATPATAADDAHPYVAEYAFGWPERALLFDVRYNHDTTATRTNNAVSLHFIDRLAGRSSLRAGEETLYPIRPILKGFLINMLVLGVLADRALVWFVLPPSRWMTRRARRLQHERRLDAGLCPTCRYPLKDSTGANCPECGAQGQRDCSPVVQKGPD